MNLHIELDQETDGRWMAEVAALPGAMTYGVTPADATAKVQALALRVLAALLRLGGSLKRKSGSHRTLARAGWPDGVSAVYDEEEIGPRMPAKIARQTGLTPNDLQGV